MTPQRIKDNFALFDFEHGDTDMQTLTALDKGADGRTGADPDVFDYVPS